MNTVNLKKVWNLLSKSLALVKYKRSIGFNTIYGYIPHRLSVMSLLTVHEISEAM
jgi:hypothetical protein